MSKTLFKNKEHYLAFRQAWSNAVNDERTKAKNLSFEECKKYPDYTWVFSDFDTKKCRYLGWIKGAHVVLYNILRDRKPYHGFTPIHNVHHLVHGAYINRGYYHAIMNLKFYHYIATESLKTTETSLMLTPERLKEVRKERGKRADGFLKPFGGNVTREMFVQIKLPKVTQLLALWGPGKDIAFQISEGRKFSYEDINRFQEKKE